MPLFSLGDFTLHSGQKSNFKIDCDALTDADWDCLAAIAVDLIAPRKFSGVFGIPEGGLKFAKALKQYTTPLLGADCFLIVDDVLTTGGSFQFTHEYLTAGPSKEDLLGIVVFARGPCPDWVTPLFTYRRWRQRATYGGET